MKELLDLYITFLKIGSVTFGGGYAMLPIIQREIVEKKQWATDDEVMDYYAIGQCTPGIIAINTSTFIGYKKKGVAGGVVATLGFVTPSLIIISVIAALIQNFAHLAIVQNGFAGIRVCVCVLILNATVKLAKQAICDKATFSIFLLVAALSLIFSFSPVVMVLSAGVAGIVINVLKKGVSEK